MSYWQNWSGRQQAKPETLCFLRSEEDARQLVRVTVENNRLTQQLTQQKAQQTIRIAGAGHSHSPLVINDGVVADISGLAGVMEVDRAAQQAWLGAGSPVYSLGAQLHTQGLALKNQGDIDRQFIAGAVATGTHGTGRELQNMSASVVALRLILATGDDVLASHEENSDLFEVARLGIGSVGLVTRVKMQLEPSRVLRESSWTASFAELYPQLDSLLSEHERMEFFWYPTTDQAVVKTINPAPGPPLYPLAGEGSRQAWSYEVLPSHRPHLHTEMEYSVPFESGTACFADIRHRLRSDFPDLRWPVEYRTVAADDIWLSMAYERPTVTLSVHQGIDEAEEPCFRACEEIFLTYGGRPHWGKTNYLDARQLEAVYPRWADWWRVRDRYDPDGVFLNSYVRSLQPAER